MNTRRIGTSARKTLRIKICWPNPDATCLEGGCAYCADGDPVALTRVRAYARRAGTLPHRLDPTPTDALTAYELGKDRATIS